MIFKSTKVFSFLAGLVLTAYGTTIGTEVSAEKISSSNSPNKQSSIETTEAIITDAFFLTASTDEAIALSAEAKDAISISTNPSEALSIDDSYSRLQKLLANSTSGETDVAGSTSRLALAQERLVLSVENANQEIASSTEEAGFQSEDYDPRRENSIGIDSFSSESFLLGDGGTPDFGETLYWSPSRPDSHAPISVMGDHTHEKGEFMFSYRYMYMNMDGNRSGTTSLSTADVLEDFMVSPVQMTMEMHMLGAMYAPTEDLTLMAMLPYITKEMDHLTRMGVEFTTNSEGIGDIRMGGLYKILDQDRQRVHLNLGVSLPTGSTNERDATPMGPDQVLPYPMQIGSGTFDLHPGITYLGQAGRWSWGSQATGIIRLGENGNGYRQGNQLMLTGWGARSWSNSFSTSLRLGGRTWGDYAGADSRLNPAVIPTADPDRRAGTQLELGLGLNFYVPEGNLQGLRFAVEFNLPVYRSLSGPQLETDFSATAGVQAAF